MCVFLKKVYRFEMKYEKLTHKILSCCMTVHSTLGNGFQEVIYQRALAIEMTKQGLGYNRKMEMPFTMKVKILAPEGLTFL